MANNEKVALGTFIVFVAIFTISNVSQLGMINSLPKDFKLIWGVLTLIFLISGIGLIAKGIQEDADKVPDANMEGLA